MKNESLLTAKEAPCPQPEFCPVNIESLDLPSDRLAYIVDSIEPEIKACGLCKIVLGDG